MTADTMTVAGEPLPDEAQWTCHDRVRTQEVRTAEEIGEPDPDWTYIDAAGHFHAWAVELGGKPCTPTLIVKQKMIPCENGPDCEADCASNGGAWEGLARHCTICDEEIKPGWRGTGRRSVSVTTGMDSEIALTVPLEAAPPWLRRRFNGPVQPLDALQVHGMVDGVTRFGQMWLGDVKVIRRASWPTMVEATLSGGLHRGLARTPAGADRG